MLPAKAIIRYSGTPILWGMEGAFTQSLKHALIASLESEAAWAAFASSFAQDMSAYPVGVSAASGSGKSQQKGFVRVQKIHGVMTQDDQECGPYGTNTMAEMLQEADHNSNIIAHVLDINSPGGEAAGMEDFNRVVAGLKKPVVTYVNGLAASAGLYAGISSKEIYISGRTARMGSIGVVLEYLDFSRRMQRMGIDEVSITATKSTKKRELNFSQPSEDDIAAIRTQLLDPFNEVFHADVKAGRPQVHEDAFDGRMYQGQSIITAGLADGFATLNSAIARAAELTNA